VGHHRSEAKPLAGSSRSSAPRAASQGKSARQKRETPQIIQIGARQKPRSHARLLRDLKHSLVNGELKDSLVGAIVVEALDAERELKLAKRYRPEWIQTGIRLSDEYFDLVNSGVGHRDWQRDFAQVLAPVLVAVTQSLARSADAQALIIRLCELVAARLRLKLKWPRSLDDRNELKNAVYRTCLDATEHESDAVLFQLRGLRVTGPQ
jgi:hypothetical protein